MEYQLSNLPRYIPITPRSQVANSPVAAGHILLFSEDGETLTAKKSDGSFESVGGGSGGGMDFYKCSAINTSTTARPEGYTLKLHCVNAENPSDTLDYNFTMGEANALVGGTTSWEDSSGQLTLTLFGNSDNTFSWGIKGPNVDLLDLSHSYEPGLGGVHPIKVWEVTSFFNNKNGKYYNATWTVSAAADAATGGAPAGLTLGFHAVCQMPGETPETVDLSFELVDDTKTGWERTWVDGNNSLTLRSKVYMEQSPSSDVDDSARTWFITQGANGGNVWEPDEQGGSNGPADPWNVSSMMYQNNGMSYNITWTESKAVAPDGTWSGYKAVLTDGGYVFSETSTAGLRYQGGFTPQVGTIYSHDAKVKVAQLKEAGTAIPQDGLVFWMPFNGSTNPKVGRVVIVNNYAGAVTYATASGITYANINGALWKASPTAADTFADLTEWTSIMYARFTHGNGAVVEHLGAGNSSLQWYFQNYSNVTPGSFSVGTEKIHFYCMRVTVGVKSVTVACDAETKTQSWGSAIPPLQNVYIGGNQSVPKMNGDIFDFALYDRLLTDEEVTALYQRVIPLQS